MESKVNIVSPKRKWISLAILFFANLMNYMDRYTVSAVLSVRRLNENQQEFSDLFIQEFSEHMCPGDEGGCSASKEGLIQTAFVIVYLLAAPIFGYLGDRHSRKYLMALGVFIWGALSLTASFMPSYWYFLVVRALIAVGR